MKESRKRLWLFLILILAAAPYFIGLSASSLWDSNEAFYAETPRVMIETGDYISPSFNDQPRFNKPPLSYWIVAVFYKVFGVSEASERLPIALGAIAMMAIAYGLGRIAYSVEAGLLAAIALAIAPRFLMFSRRIIIDVWVSMFMAAALLFFALAEARPQKRRLYLALMYAGLGLGVMTKGPVAIALPALCFLVYLMINRNFGKLREMMIPMGAVIIAAIVLPWYVAVYAKHGWQYIETFILKDNLSRYTEPVWGPRRGFFFYLPVLVGDMFPWSVFMAIAAGLAVKKYLGKNLFPLAYLRRKLGRNKNQDRSRKSEAASVSADIAHQDNDDKQSRPSALLAVWVITIVAFYSLSRNKEDLYILPVFPAAAAIAGGLLARFINKELPQSPHAFTRWAAAFIALIISLAGAVVLYLFGGASVDYDIAGSTAIGVAAIAGGVVALGAIFMRKEFAAIAATALAVIAINWVFATTALPDFEKYKPARAMAEIIKTEAAPDAIVGYYRFAAPSMRFYLKRHIFEYYKPEDFQSDEFQSALKAGRSFYWVMTEQDYEALKGALPEPTYVLASRSVFQVKLKGILDRAELPQVVLISNKDGAYRAR